MSATRTEWLLFKAWLRSLTPRSRALKERYGAAADRLHTEALHVAADALAREMDGLEELWPQLGYRLNDQVLLQIELPFLWGIFHEAVANSPSLPTNGYDRVTILVIAYLMKHRGMSLDKARAQALEADTRYQQAEPLFEVLQERGRRVYRDRSVGHLADAVVALEKAGLRDGKVPR